MKRLKLKHNYHDARISAVEYRDHDIILDIDLCCRESVGPKFLQFLAVRNFDEVHDALEAVRRANSDRAYIDEIIGIVRSDERGFLIDLQTSGAVVIDAGRILE